MRMTEYIEQYVDKNFDTEVEKNREQIINYLLSHDEINIGTQPFSTDEVIRISKTEPLDIGPLITVTDSGIVIRTTSEKLEKLIISNLSKNIKSIKAPNKVIDSLNFEEYKNLDEISFTEKKVIDREYLDKISNTCNIKKINGSITYTSNQEDEIIFRDGRNREMIIYKELVVRHPNFEIFNSIEVQDKNTFKNMDKIFQVINEEKNEDLTRIEIKTKKEQSFLNCSVSYSTIGGAKIKIRDFNSISEVITTIESFEKNGYNLEQVEVYLENKDYEDIHLLKGVEEKYVTKFKYEKSIAVTFEEFIAMRATLNYFKSVIEGNDLSPFEKLIYAYDIIKSFEYEHSKVASDSRNIHSIIRDGKIVCVGYSKFLTQLLAELGIDSVTLDVSAEKWNESGHKRNIVFIHDDKYGIDGSFALDATFDSARNLVKVINDNGDERIGPSELVKDTYIIEKYYDNLSLYDNFMIPESEYEQVFKEENSLNLDESLFDADKYAKVVSKFKGGERPSLETILRAVSVVRLKQGYSKEQAIESIKDTIEIVEYQKRREKEQAAAAVKM